MEPLIYLAPMQGYTDVVFRQTWARFFERHRSGRRSFHHAAEGPPQHRRLRFRDLVPENNAAMPVIPQILTRHSEEFGNRRRTALRSGLRCGQLESGLSVSHGSETKGSGMLPIRDRIDRFLEAVIPAIPNRVSIKTRIGRNHRRRFWTCCPYSTGIRWKPSSFIPEPGFRCMKALRIWLFLRPAWKISRLRWFTTEHSFQS